MDNDRKKLEMFCRLCSDVDYRNRLFQKPESQVVLQKLQLRDFPIRNLLNCPPFDLTTSLLYYDYIYAKIKGRRDKRVLEVAVETQLDFLNKSLTTSSMQASLSIFSGITDFQKSRFITFLLIFFKSLTKNPEYEGNQERPLWHFIRGGFDDPLRDLEEYRNQKGTISTLILDGVTPTCSKLKTEKFNDIISLYHSGGTDIIIIGGGFDPLKIAAEVLNTTFQVGLFFNEGLIVSL